MDKIWLEQYGPGVAFEVERGGLETLVDLCADSIAKFGDRPVLHHMGREITYKEFDRLCDEFAGYLQGQLKLEKGQAVALMMPNVLQYPIALFGILRAGLIAVNINPLYTARELKQQLNDARATTIIVLENFCAALSECISETPVKNVITASVGEMLSFPKSLVVDFALRHVKKMVPAWSIPQAVTFSTALKLGKSVGFKPVKIAADDTAFLQYTGGTTGTPKGAILTHANVLSNVLQIHAFLQGVLAPGEEVSVMALPLYHTAALICQFFAGLKYGACIVLITNPKDIGGLIKELKKHKFTLLGGVNTLFNALLNHPEIGSLDYSSLRFTFSGAMAMQKVVAERWKALTGCTMIEAYGLTETAGVAVMNPTSVTDCMGSIGIPVPSTEIQIRDEEGREVGFNTPGELCIKGPQVMKGYLNRPEETAKILDQDGFVATGDIATIDQRGYLRIVDRKKDMILVSGFNVFPNEIEDVLSRHPNIKEVAAVGLPDQKTGEKVAVFVVKKDESLTEEQVLQAARMELTAYKVPKAVYFAEELPKSPVGKILRRELRELAPHLESKRTKVGLR